MSSLDLVIARVKAMTDRSAVAGVTAKVLQVQGLDHKKLLLRIQARHCSALSVRSAYNLLVFGSAVACDAPTLVVFSTVQSILHAAPGSHELVSAASRFLRCAPLTELAELVCAQEELPEVVCLAALVRVGICSARFPDAHAALVQSFCSLCRLAQPLFPCATALCASLSPAQAESVLLFLDKGVKRNGAPSAENLVRFVKITGVPVPPTLLAQAHKLLPQVLVCSLSDAPAAAALDALASSSSMPVPECAALLATVLATPASSQGGPEAVTFAVQHKDLRTLQLAVCLHMGVAPPDRKAEQLLTDIRFGRVPPSPEVLSVLVRCEDTGALFPEIVRVASRVCPGCQQDNTKLRQALASFGTVSDTVYAVYNAVFDAGEPDPASSFDFLYSYVRNILPKPAHLSPSTAVRLLALFALSRAPESIDSALPPRERRSADPVLPLLVSSCEASEGLREPLPLLHLLPVPVLCSVARLAPWYWFRTHIHAVVAADPVLLEFFLSGCLRQAVVHVADVSWAVQQLWALPSNVCIQRRIFGLCILLCDRLSSDPHPSGLVTSHRFGILDEFVRTVTARAENPKSKRIVTLVQTTTTQLLDTLDSIAAQVGVAQTLAAQMRIAVYLRMLAVMLDKQVFRKLRRVGFSLLDDALVLAARLFLDFQSDTLKLLAPSRMFPTVANLLSLLGSLVSLDKEGIRTLAKCARSVGTMLSTDEADALSPLLVGDCADARLCTVSLFSGVKAALAPSSVLRLAAVALDHSSPKTAKVCKKTLLSRGVVLEDIDPDAVLAVLRRTTVPEGEKVLTAAILPICVHRGVVTEKLVARLEALPVLAVEEAESLRVQTSTDFEPNHRQFDPERYILCRALVAVAGAGPLRDVPDVRPVTKLFEWALAQLELEHNLADAKLVIADFAACLLESLTLAQCNEFFAFLQQRLIRAVDAHSEADELNACLVALLGALATRLITYQTVVNDFLELVLRLASIPCEKIHRQLALGVSKVGGMLDQERKDMLAAQYSAFDDDDDALTRGKCFCLAAVLGSWENVESFLPRVGTVVQMFVMYSFAITYPGRLTADHFGVFFGRLLDFLRSPQSDVHEICRELLASFTDNLSVSSVPLVVPQLEERLTDDTCHWKIKVGCLDVVSKLTTIRDPVAYARVVGLIGAIASNATDCHAQVSRSAKRGLEELTDLIVNADVKKHQNVIIDAVCSPRAVPAAIRAVADLPLETLDTTSFFLIYIVVRKAIAHAERDIRLHSIVILARLLRSASTEALNLDEVEMFVAKLLFDSDEDVRYETSQLLLALLDHHEEGDLHALDVLADSLHSDLAPERRGAALGLAVTVDTWAAPNSGSLVTMDQFLRPNIRHAKACDSSLLFFQYLLRYSSHLASPEIVRQILRTAVQVGLSDVAGDENIVGDVVECVTQVAELLAVPLTDQLLDMFLSLTAAPVEDMRARIPKMVTRFLTQVLGAEVMATPSVVPDAVERNLGVERAYTLLLVALVLKNSDGENRDREGAKNPVAYAGNVLLKFLASNLPRTLRSDTFARLFFAFVGQQSELSGGLVRSTLFPSLVCCCADVSQKVSTNPEAFDMWMRSFVDAIETHADVWALYLRFLVGAVDPPLQVCVSLLSGAFEDICAGRVDDDASDEITAQAAILFDSMHKRDPDVYGQVFPPSSVGNPRMSALHDAVVLSNPQIAGGLIPTICAEVSSDGSGIRKLVAMAHAAPQLINDQIRPRIVPFLLEHSLREESVQAAVAELFGILLADPTRTHALLSGLMSTETMSARRLNLLGTMFSLPDFPTIVETQLQSLTMYLSSMFLIDAMTPQWKTCMAALLPAVNLRLAARAPFVEHLCTTLQKALEELPSAVAVDIGTELAPHLSMAVHHQAPEAKRRLLDLFAVLLTMLPTSPVIWKLVGPVIHVCNPRQAPSILVQGLSLLAQAFQSHENVTKFLHPVLITLPKIAAESNSSRVMAAVTALAKVVAPLVPRTAAQARDPALVPVVDLVVSTRRAGQCPKQLLHLFGTIILFSVNKPLIPWSVVQTVLNVLDDKCRTCMKVNAYAMAAALSLLEPAPRAEAITALMTLGKCPQLGGASVATVSERLLLVDVVLKSEQELSEAVLVAVAEQAVALIAGDGGGGTTLASVTSMTETFSGSTKVIACRILGHTLAFPLPIESLELVLNNLSALAVDHRTKSDLRSYALAALWHISRMPHLSLIDASADTLNNCFTALTTCAQSKLSAVKTVAEDLCYFLLSSVPNIEALPIDEALVRKLAFFYDRFSRQIDVPESEVDEFDQHFLG